MNAKASRAALAADPDIGTGNVLSTLIARQVGLDEPRLTFDTNVAGHPAWQPMTLRQLEAHVRARAAWLYDHGIRSRDPVAVYVTTAADQVLSFLALTRIGAIPALVNRNVSGPVAARYIERVRPVAVLVDPSHQQMLSGETLAADLLIDVNETSEGDGAKAPEQFRYHPEDAAVITHSSGTTGAPKAVVASHESLYFSVRHRLSLPRKHGIDRMLSALPANHAAMVILLNLSLCSAAEVAMLSDQSSGTVLDAIERWRPTCVLGFAATWSELARMDLSAYDLDSVQIWWNTGDCAHEPHIRRLISLGRRKVVTPEGVREAAGSAFIDGLGSTEMGHSQFFITHTPETDRYGRCIGKPHAFADVAVLDETGEKLPSGVVGQLGVRSPTMAVGYWNDSLTTYRSRLRGYLLTGDLVYRDQAGWYYHLDRAVDSATLPDGKRIHTAQSEERILAACPEVLDCSVVAVTQPDGEVATTVLVNLAPATDRTEDRADEVRAALEPHVAATVRAVLVDNGEIPYGPTGKVRKVLLRERHALQHSSPGTAGR